MNYLFDLGWKKCSNLGELKLLKMSWGSFWVGKFWIAKTKEEKRWSGGKKEGGTGGVWPPPASRKLLMRTYLSAVSYLNRPLLFVLFLAMGPTTFPTKTFFTLHFFPLIGDVSSQFPHSQAFFYVTCKTFKNPVFSNIPQNYG